MKRAGDAMQAQELVTRLVVALETSTRTPSIAVRLGGELRVRTLSSERAHASDLVPALAELLGELEALPSEISAVVVGLGPGSYTGLRVGVATALGLARGSGARALGVPSGEALAFAELAPGEAGCQLVDLRQGSLSCSHYLRLQHEVEVLRAPYLIPREEVALHVPAGALLFADEGAASALETELSLRARVRIGKLPGAAALLQLGASRLLGTSAADVAELEPLYLREFQAKPRRR